MDNNNELISTFLVERVYKISITILGLVGNILTIIILTNKRNRKSSTATYLLALAVSDIIIILFGPFCDWLEIMWHVFISEYGEFACKVQTFMQYSSSTTSSWLLVVVTIERAISVTYPYKVRTSCTKQIAIIVVVITWTLVYAANLHFLFGMGQSYNNQCDAITPNYMKFAEYILPWVDFTLSFFFPFIFLLLGNAVIIRQLTKHRSRQKYLTHSNVPNNLAVSLVLVLVDFVFVITVGPIYVFSIVFPYFLGSLSEEEKNSIARFWGPMLHGLWETNAALNIVLYVMSGTRFRNELLRLLCFCCKKNQKSNGVFDTSANFNPIYVRSSLRRAASGEKKGSQLSMDLMPFKSPSTQIAHRNDLHDYDQLSIISGKRKTKY
ncbi:hypothetical protein DPMN_054495 [Dreissena polymorpha]|uniref:G-protein coupled receptors family 1 profile domain-containing protein n=1 Tax=Dreissena polymorpha TaxID=45954 RepID=A0A9D4CN82_DREPO|nr:hypothetical protein DPMN_054495 [Dreissena polymorpha]